VSKPYQGGEAAEFFPNLLWFSLCPGVSVVNGFLDWKPSSDLFMKGAMKLPA
jgi:hypothetical protein